MAVAVLKSALETRDLPQIGRALDRIAPPQADKPPQTDRANSADPANAGRHIDEFALRLLRAGLIHPSDLVPAISGGYRRESGTPTRLLAEGRLSEEMFLKAAAAHFGVNQLDLGPGLADGALIDQLGARFCLQNGLIPWRKAGAVTVVATSRPSEFAGLRQVLADRLGPVVMALAPAAQIEAALVVRRGSKLAIDAEQRVPLAQSCRSWNNRSAYLGMLAGIVLLLMALYFHPMLLGLVALGTVMSTLFLSTGLRLYTGLAAPLLASGNEAIMPPNLHPPRVSIIVALYKEADIAARLVRRLSRLDYPKDLFEVILAVESDDHVTRQALAQATLPGWMRVILAPEGTIRTKPRALNMALDYCRGDIIGVYDAEDAPEPDQIRKVVSQFSRADAKTACLQGMLDYYNPTTNWIARCFTVEYAGWFRLLLPGLARRGMVVPLGGTTLFFRRDALEKLGCWDAHNVTEDADLGLRLHRAGYRTEIVSSVTYEEANCHIVPWVKQRSRWIKGYMITWLIHMRSPRALWQEIGPKAFFVFQIMFLGTFTQNLLAPLMWSFWALAFGLGHPIATALPWPGPLVIIGLFVIAAGIECALLIAALGRGQHKISRASVLLMTLYHPLATFAAYKALWELIVKPFYWDKTSHGLYDKAALPE